jgi:hypothetical protein
LHREVAEKVAKRLLRLETLAERLSDLGWRIPRPRGNDHSEMALILHAGLDFMLLEIAKEHPNVTPACYGESLRKHKDERPISVNEFWPQNG